MISSTGVRKRVLRLFCLFFSAFAFAGIAEAPPFGVAEGSPRARAVMEWSGAAGLDPVECSILYGTLLRGEVIRNGSSGDNARTAQKLLNALGAGIAADGQVGARTMTALSSIYRSYFGEEAAEGLDRDTFESLLFALISTIDMNAARGIYNDAMHNEIAYANAVGMLLSGRNYAAQKALIALGDYDDSAVRAGQCALVWPETGELFRASAYKDAECPVIVKANRALSEATYVLFRGEDGAAAAKLFIAGSDMASTRLNPGLYEVFVGTGTTWYGEREAFGAGSDATYRRLLFAGESRYATIIEGYEAAITLEVGNIAPGAQAVEAEVIGLASFAGE